MLERSPIARRTGQPAEEWAIHDYEGFGPVHLGEYTDLDTVSRVGQGIAEHGMAFAHWAAHVDPTETDRLDDFESAYLGEWQSPEEYAEHLLDDLGYLDEIERIIPQHLRPYLKVDNDLFGRDLVLSGDLLASENEAGSMYLFDATI